MRTRAFTLVELLIVAAILAILAAIAVPNFLESHTRAKVSRARSEMRSLSTAIESYHVDNGKYPRQGPPDTCAIALCGLPELTTPIAYLEKYPNDLFRAQKGCQEALSYGTCSSGSVYYYVWSFGPDRANQMATLIYDPTNGTVSEGDVKRSTARDVSTIAPQP